MMKTLKILSLAALATVAAATAGQAANSTNLLENVSFQFTVYSQGASTTNLRTQTITTSIASTTVTTKEIIAALSKDASITTTPFSSSAYLALVTPVVSQITTNTATTPPTYTTNLVGGQSSVVVVDGARIVTVPSSVIGNITPTATPIAEEVISASGILTYKKLVTASSVTVNIPGEWNLAATGLATITADNIAVGKGKTAGVVPIFTADLTLSGAGIEGAGTTVVVSGTVTETYLKTLIQ